MDTLLDTGLTPRVHLMGDECQEIRRNLSCTFISLVSSTGLKNIDAIILFSLDHNY